MGPVSFERIVSGLDRHKCLEAARRLTAAGIRVQVLDDEVSTMVVRSEDAVLARSILERFDG